MLIALVIQCSEILSIVSLFYSNILSAVIYDSGTGVKETMRSAVQKQASPGRAFGHFPLP